MLHGGADVGRAHEQGVEHLMVFSWKGGESRGVSFIKLLWDVFWATRCYEGLEGKAFMTFRV